MSRVCCSLLTPPGLGAIAVVSLRGPGAWTLAATRLTPVRGSWPQVPRAGEIRRASFQAGDELVDDVLAIARDGAGAHLEITCHGGRRVVERILAAMLDAGAELRPTEYSGNEADWRALLRNAADYLLSRTTTTSAALFLARQRELLPERLQAIIARGADQGAAGRRALLSALLEESAGARYWAEPAEIAIVGPPNAGKSLLANRLAGREEAVVTGHAGTTRDWISISTAWEGLPVRLVDTAGLRPTTDPLEDLAIARGVQRVRQTDAGLIVLDGSRPLPPGRLQEWLAVIPGRPVLLVLNKLDLGTSAKVEAADFSGRILSVSALTGEGLPALTRAVRQALRVPPADSARGLLFAGFLREWLQNRLATSEEFTGPGIAANLAAACARHADSGRKQGYNG